MEWVELSGGGVGVVTGMGLEGLGRKGEGDEWELELVPWIGLVRRSRIDVGAGVGVESEQALAGVEGRGVGVERELESVELGGGGVGVETELELVVLGLGVRLS